MDIQYIMNKLNIHKLDRNQLDVIDKFNIYSKNKTTAIIKILLLICLNSTLGISFDSYSTIFILVQGFLCTLIVYKTYCLIKY